MKKLLNKIITAQEVCTNCGLKYGTTEGDIATYSPGKCGICKERTIVTNVRAFGYLKAGRERIQKEIDQVTKETARKKVEKIKAKASKPIMKQLRTTLQRVTHKIVRLRSDRCYTCNKPLAIADRNAGHFWSQGGHGAVKYDFRNIRCQCTSCNSFKSGNLAEYGTKLRKEIGGLEYDKLCIEAHMTRRFTRDELENMIAQRQLMLKALTDERI